MACLSKASYTKIKAVNRSHLVYKRRTSLTNLASGVQNWRFIYKYAVFNLQTSISLYKLAPRITTQLSNPGTGIFMDKMRDMIQIYNHTSEICFDDKKIYLIV